MNQSTRIYILEAFALPLAGIGLVLTLVCAALTGCATYNANLTTTSGSQSSTVDNPGPIAKGAAVTSANTASNTTVTDITGNAITLSAPASATGTVSALFKNTVAVQFQADITKYNQTVANFLQTNGPIVLANVGNVAKLTKALAGQLQAWGLDPSTDGQRTALDNAISIASKVGTNAASLSSLLTGIQTTGVVPTTN